MKKKVLCISSALVMLAAFCVFQNRTKDKINLSELTLENVEALSTTNLDEVVVTCSSGPTGKCYRKGCELKFCKKYSYYQCEYTGYMMDNCSHPC